MNNHIRDTLLTILLNIFCLFKRVCIYIRVFTFYFYLKFILCIDVKIVSRKNDTWLQKTTMRRDMQIGNKTFKKVRFYKVQLQNLR